MTPVEERLKELLHTAVPSLTGVEFEAVAGRVRRRRRAGFASLTVATAAVIALVVALGFALAGSSGHDVERVTTTPSPAPSIAPPSISFQGIAFLLPSGWKQAVPSCYPADHTVTIGEWEGDCPVFTGPVKATTNVHLDTLYGPQSLNGWSGARTTFAGQPAWRLEYVIAGRTFVRLSLPWLNALVTTSAPDAATASALLDQVRLRALPGLQVPRQASTIFIQSLAGHDGDPLVRNATLYKPADVTTILSDLRSLPAITARQACDGSWGPHSALLTVHSSNGTRTYAAEFAPCSTVVAGTGSAASASAQLLADIRRLVPNSGL